MVGRCWCGFGCWCRGGQERGRKWHIGVGQIGGDDGNFLHKRGRQGEQAKWKNNSRNKELLRWTS